MSAKGGLSCRSQEKRAEDQIKCVVSHGNQQNDFAQRIHERDVRTINKRPRLGPISLPFPSVHPGGQQRERPLREMQRSQGVGDGKAGGLSQSSRFNGKSHRGVTCRTLDTGPWEAACLAVAAGAQTQTQLGGADICVPFDVQTEIERLPAQQSAPCLRMQPRCWFRT
jgi:hypothetical protein